MIEFNKEYFNNNCYFFLKEKEDSISLYYNVAETITESRKSDNKMDFDKSQLKKVKDVLDDVIKSNKKFKKTDIEKKLKSIKKPKKELEELVKADGTMAGSRVPIHNLALSPRKTMDQTVPMARVSNDPVTRGYRVYWGEGEEKEDDVLSEVDYSDAFGYEETKDKDFKNTIKTLKKMGVENPIERAKQFGKLPKVKRKGGKLKQRLSEKETLDEIRKQKMVKMVEDILTKKNKDESDVIGNDKPINKIIMKNLQSIKKLADKEGISLNKLINILKKGE